MFVDKEKFETYIEVVSPLLSLKKSLCAYSLSARNNMWEMRNKEGGKAQSSKRREEENKIEKKKKAKANQNKRKNAE